jgi:hypothetical protein
MNHSRVAALAMFGLLFAASGQSVRSTHSGLLYFFDGQVFVGDELLQQKFGRFPEIGAGHILRTERGRAEVLLTPGVCLRIDENSAFRMVSDSLADTRVELLHGSVIVEVNHEAANPPDTLVYKNWQVQVQQDSIARIDSEPAQVRVLSGTATVSTEGSDLVTVHRGEVLPFASVLVGEQATTPAADAFNTWAMNRSSVVSEDNEIGAGITDDPSQVDSSGVALAGFSYFPPTGIPSLGISYPYGLSFWSIYPSWVNPYASVYPYGLFYRSLYQRMPTSTFLYPRPITISPGLGLAGRPYGFNLPRPSYAPMVRPSIGAPHFAAPHVIRR